MPKTLSAEPEGRRLTHLSVRRPDWLPAYIPELQGLRGLAVLAVVLYHCHPRLAGTWVYGASLWGWAGVNLFFVLSGFLITSILLESRTKPHYFRNFYGRRVLRIWPVYVLLLVVVYLEAPWFIGPSIGQAILTAPWWAYILFIQNLFHLSLPPAIGPTWSLAIEEQYYFLWAPLVRVLRRPWMLGTVLVAALIGSPLVRLCQLLHWMTPTNTLIHLDGIAWGSLLALGLHRLPLRRRTWVLARPGRNGRSASGPQPRSPAALVSRLRSGHCLCRRGAGGHRLHRRAQPVNRALAKGPLAYYGRISYGLYMIHISVFIFFGWFDLQKWTATASPATSLW